MSKCGALLIAASVMMGCNPSGNANNARGGGPTVRPDTNNSESLRHITTPGGSLGLGGLDSIAAQPRTSVQVDSSNAPQPTRNGPGTGAVTNGSAR